jgi:hypothetical protein
VGGSTQSPTGIVKLHCWWSNVPFVSRYYMVILLCYFYHSTYAHIQVHTRTQLYGIAMKTNQIRTDTADTNSSFFRIKFSNQIRIRIDHHVSNIDIHIQILEIQLWISGYEYGTYSYGYWMLGFGYHLTIWLFDPVNRMDGQIIYVSLSSLHMSVKRLSQHILKIDKVTTGDLWSRGMSRNAEGILVVHSPELNL